MPNQVKQTWHGDEVVAKLTAEAFENLTRATVYLWQRCQWALSAPYAGRPSRPGEPPKRRTGFGVNHVGYELDRAALKSRVGVNPAALYLAMHEAGIRGVKRPWLLATLDKHLEQVRALAAGRSGA